MAVAHALPRSRTYVDPTLGAGLQRLQDGAEIELVVDGRVILAETSVRISRTLGPLAVDAWLAMNAVWVEDGFGSSGKCSSSMRRLARLIWPASKAGGKTNRMLRDVVDRLYDFSVTADDFDVVSGELRPGALSKARLLTELSYDRDLRLGSSDGRYDAAVSGTRTGGLRDQSVSWRFAERYVEHAHGGGLLTLDLERLSRLDGVAKSLWVQMSTPRFPFQAGVQPGVETASIDLTDNNFRALGIVTTSRKQQRRTLKAAGQRIVAADPGYLEVDCDLRSNQLRITRSTDYVIPMVFPEGAAPSLALTDRATVYTPSALKRADASLKLF